MNKILIANRGEIALRVMRSAKEMNIKTVAIYSEADRNAPFVRYADEAVCVGPPPSAESYLLGDKIIQICKDLNVDGIHPGYGFLSENSEFVLKATATGITFIGPSPKSIELMGDKLKAKDTVKAYDIPMVPGTDHAISDIPAAKKIAKEIGFPILIKASAGGGGKGMRAVWKSEDLKEAWDAARQESKAAFGNNEMYMEKLIEEPRHIEIQIIGDAYGKACHLSERDCSVQRRHQKLTEETPSPYMTDELREKMGDSAVKAAEFIKYEGAGTVEFLVDKHRNFYFMEMNTRIQVEHPITEEVVNYDLIREQILVAAGTPISGKNYYPKMHSIECRINAENPALDFQPSPGIISVCHQPSGFRTRVDGAIFQGCKITPYYDSLIAKVICKGRNRTEAIQRTLRSLDEFVLEGITTTIDLHKKILNHKKFINSDFDTNWLSKEKFY